MFQRYLDEQATGDRTVWVAEPAAELVGYICVVWRSRYRPFRDAGIPEIVDFNVLPAQRRHGVGTALMAR